MLKEYPSPKVMLNGTRIDLQEPSELYQNVVLGEKTGFVVNKLGVLYLSHALGVTLTKLNARSLSLQRLNS